MGLSTEQIESKKTIAKIKANILEAIDQVCKEKKYQLTYAEINSALTDVLKSNLNHELNDYYKEKDGIKGT